MRLQEYIILAKERLDSMEADWIAGHEHNPELWPLDQPEGEWCEADLMYMDSEHDDAW